MVLFACGSLIQMLGSKDSELNTDKVLDSGFNPEVDWKTFCVESTCSLCACEGF